MSGLGFRFIQQAYLQAEICTKKRADGKIEKRLAIALYAMGYTTIFDGSFHLDERLFDSQVLYLLEFSRTRRVKRDVSQLENAPDPAREAVGLPLGVEGGYFVNQKWNRENGQSSIIEYNLPPAGQPGLWCQWIPTSNGGGIEWDRGEKFYKYIAWLEYIIVHFLEPWGYRLQGEVSWQGEDLSDKGRIVVEDNKIVWPEGNFLKDATSPIPVPPAVLAGIEAVLRSDPTAIWSWLAMKTEAIALGYPETSEWIAANLDDYFEGISRGFVAE